MYNKPLVVLAKKLGFESKFFSDQPWKFSEREPMRYQLWLEELKQWLINNYDLYVEVPKTMSTFINNESYKKTYKFTFNIKDITDEHFKTTSLNGFDSYLKALEVGVHRTLIYIDEIK
jgi:hypothetical protein